jgi:carboxymethylenebutenolidase
MIITESHKDVPTQAGGDMSRYHDRRRAPVNDKSGIFLFHPSIPNYPKAKFPGVVVFSEIYQGEISLVLSLSLSPIMLQWSVS